MRDLMEPTPIQNGAHAPATVAEEALSRGYAMQQTKSSYSTAVFVQKPRQLADVNRRLLEEARLAGEDFYYGWTAGKDRIEGPSVNLAVAAARCWGNCAVDTMPVQSMPDAWIFTAIFIDLETGFTMTRQFRQSKKWTVHGKLDDERKDDVRFQIGQSKAIRNVVLKAIPATIINKAMEEAKSGVRSKIEAYVQQKGLPAAIDMIIKALAKCGVKEELILEKCGVAERKAIDIDHLVVLRGDLHAIESGQEYADNLFPAQGKEDSGKPTTPKKGTEALADKLSGKKEEKDDGKATKQQLKQLKEFMGVLNIPEAEVVTTTKKYGADSLEALTKEKAELLLLDWGDAVESQKMNAEMVDEG